jgi:DNA repair exonuclease SbcCD ATPase subunit
MGKGGRSSEDQLQPSELLSLPKFQPFQQDDFNAADFTSSVLAASKTTAHAQSEELKQGVRQLDAALSTHVLTHHQDLLQHARKLVDTEHSLQDVMSSVGSLQASVKRIRAEIEGPYLQIQIRTRQLSNIHSTVELLRQLIHRLKLVQKLRQQMQVAPNSIDLAKAAKLITDIHMVSREADLSGIDAAEADEEFLRHAISSIQDQAQVSSSSLPIACISAFVVVTF